MTPSADNAELFYVYDGGTLVAAGYESPRDRSEAFCIDESDVERSLGDLILECSPLTSHLINEFDEFVSPDRLPQDEEDRLNFIDGAVPSITERLKAATVEWLRSPPDFGDAEYFVVEADGQAVAYNHFSRIGTEIRTRLCIVIVEGDHPGSSYYAAELRCGVDEANRVSGEHDLPYVFEQAQW